MSTKAEQSNIAWVHQDSPIGRLVILADSEGITEIRFPNNGASLLPQCEPEHRKENKWLDLASEQLTAYFDSRLEVFDLPLSLSGTDFQKAVWRQLQKVAYGKTASYGQIAAAVNKPKAARAVGMANNKNTIPIIIPCHRIIGSDGSLTGFAGGLDTKRWLLHHEGVGLKSR